MFEIREWAVLSEKFEVLVRFAPNRLDGRSQLGSRKLLKLGAIMPLWAAKYGVETAAFPSDGENAHLQVQVLVDAVA